MTARATDRHLVHEALDGEVGATPLEVVRWTDQQRLSAVLQGAALLAHAEHGGLTWSVDGSAVGVWRRASWSSEDRLLLPAPRIGRVLDMPQVVMSELLRQVFGHAEVAGRGAARRSARQLFELWRQDLAPTSPDLAVDQVLEAAPFLWGPTFANARRALVAEQVIDGANHLWFAGPGRVRRRFLTCAEGDKTKLYALVTGPQAVDLWQGVSQAADPWELMARGRYRRAAAVWRRQRARSREETLAYARCHHAVGRYSAALEALSRRRDVPARLLRARCQWSLGERHAARRTVYRLASAELTDGQLIELAELAIRLAAAKGERDQLERWMARLQAIDGADSTPMALLVAAEAAWDLNRFDLMEELLGNDRVAAASRAGEPKLVGRWHHVTGLLAYAKGDGLGYAHHVGQALLVQRRLLLVADAGRLWNDLAVARVQADDLPGAERACRHALRLLMRCEGPTHITLALYNLAEVLVRRGRFSGVESTLERSTAANRRAGNTRALLRDLELWARLELAQGRVGAALSRCQEAVQLADRGAAPARRQVFDLFSARAYGWLGDAERAAELLAGVEPELLSEIDLEERPAVWALAGEHDTACREAHGAPWQELWGALAAHCHPTTEAWEQLDRLEPYRASRLILDCELSQRGVVPPHLVRRAVEALRQTKADDLAERLEQRSLDPWRILGAYFDHQAPSDQACRELFASAGYGDSVGIRLHRGGEARWLVGSAARSVEPPKLCETIGDTELSLHCDALDSAQQTLFAVVRRDLELAAAPEVVVDLEVESAQQGSAKKAGAAHREIRSDGIVGTSDGLRRAIERLDKLAGRDLPMLILGESGTGKELMARRAHRTSRRHAGPFLAINCAALSESLIQADLFGHVRGAFTGADRDRAGVFESARGGTVFLDEIGDMPFDSQGKLLRVLQEGEIRRVGETFARKVDVRVVAATHRDLESMVEARSFRQDLYFRLRVAKIELPPLRQRGDDVVQLAEHFLRQLPSRRLRLDASAMQALTVYNWPGNVRELRSVLEVGAALADSNALSAADLDLPNLDTSPEPVESKPSDYHRQVRHFRKRLISEALVGAGGNRARAARSLQMSRQAFSYLVRQLGLS